MCYTSGSYSGLECSCGHLVNRGGARQDRERKVAESGRFSYLRNTNHQIARRDLRNRMQKDSGDSDHNLTSVKKSKRIFKVHPNLKDK